MATLYLSDGLATLTRRTQAAVAVTNLFIGVSFATALGELLEVIGVLDFNSLEADGLTSMFGLVYILYFCAFLASVVVIGMWIYRAHANLRAAGAETEFSPGWAVGWYFVPIASLFKPFQAMRELVNASHLTANDFGDEAPADVKTWWGCFIIGGILGNVSARMGAFSDAATPAASLLDVASTALLTGAAWKLLGIIRDVDAAQRNELAAAEAFA